MLAKTLLLMLFLSNIAISAPVAGQADSVSGPHVVPRGAVLCGPRAVYLMLLAYKGGSDPNFIDGLTPTKAEGMSLFEVCTALQQQGLHATAQECSIEQVRNLKFPAVLLVEARRHFLLLLSVDKSHAKALDPISARVYDIPVARLAEQRLVVAAVDSTRSSTALASLMCFLGAFGFGYALRPRKACQRNVLVKSLHIPAPAACC